MKIAVLIGTRPEAIKLAPVIQALRSRAGHDILICATGQHRELLDQALDDFELKVDENLAVMVECQSLPGLTARLLGSLAAFYSQTSPDWVIVQGDTTTVMAAALCAYYHHIKVAHVEAGLRSFNKFSPFPEEGNRKITGVLADIHFAPTETARNNLLAEGVSPTAVQVTGNTIVDALNWMRQTGLETALPDFVRDSMAAKAPLVLVTCHRRENFGAALKRICAALRELARLYPAAIFVFPLHPNPQVSEVVAKELSGLGNMHLIAPLPYKSLLALMEISSLVLSDSGGIQEEAPSFGVPVLVLRETTERPEGLAAGFARLVGSTANRIVSAAAAVLKDPASAKAALLGKQNPYGDGKAGQRIAKVLYGD